MEQNKLLQTFVVCPNCGRPLCREDELDNFSNKYCGKCGAEITSAMQEAKALVNED